MDLWIKNIKSIEKISGVKQQRDKPQSKQEDNMQYYQAIFHPSEEKEGGYVVTFPDLPGCVTQGNTETEALDMAMDALKGFLEMLKRDGDPIPAASDYNEAWEKAKAEAEATGEVLHPKVIRQPVPVNWYSHVTMYRD